MMPPEKKVLLFSRDPGGANTIIPLVKPLREKGYNAMLYGKDVALNRYADAGLPSSDIISEVNHVSPDAIENFLRTVHPDVVITGTSADDFTEKYLWQAAGRIGIPSMAIIDQWTNYGLRFSDFLVSEISEYLKRKNHPYCPSVIVAMDDYSRIEMIHEGLPSEKIVVCGQPYFETIASFVPNPEELAGCNQRNAIRDDDFVVVFASEPIIKTCGDTALSFWGYSERSIFSSLVRALHQNTRKSTGQRVVLVIRPHPKESRDGLLDIVKQYPDLHWSIDAETSPRVLIKRGDLVCGMSSMFLIESVIMGRPTMSIQIGLKRENPFILDRQGTLASILTEDDLYSQLGRIINHKEYNKPRFDVIHNSVERIISEMENLIWQNLQ